MRARLLFAMLALVAAALLLETIGSVLLIQGASTSTAEQELHSQAQVVAQLYARAVGVPGARAAITRIRHDIRALGDYNSINVAVLTPSGTFTRGIPPDLKGLDLHPGSLSSGHSVAGTSGELVYELIPLPVAPSQTPLRGPLAAGDTLVLVATRVVGPPVIGLGWFVLIGLGLLALATVVAVWLSRRFSRPVVAAADATRRIAGGDLTTRLPAGSIEVPEFAQLSGAINTLAASLSQARDQQRQFLLSVSHDLRTPLTSIRGYVEAVSEGAIDDVDGALAVIASEATRLERLVRDLLDLARLDAKHFTLDLAPVEVGDVLTRTKERFGPEATAAGVGIDTHLPDGSLWVLADHDRVVQVLSNLVENALTFARSRVSLGAVRGPEARAVLWIDDDGAGIAGADLPHVFSPHFTSDRSPRRRSGTGLGLAIVAELVAAMRGDCRAESPPAGARSGTRVMVRLPLCSPPATARAVTGPESTGDQASGSSRTSPSTDAAPAATSTTSPAATDRWT